MRDSSEEVKKPFGGLASPFCDLTGLVGFEGVSACKTPIAGSIPAVALVDENLSLEPPSRKAGKLEGKMIKKSNPVSRRIVWGV